jgi:HEAT repeat protein
LQTLVNTQYNAKASVTPLVDCLKDGNPNVRLFACTILGNIGPDAAAALPALRDLQNDSNANVQNSARAAIGRIESKK